MLEPLKVSEEAGRITIKISGSLTSDRLELLKADVESGKEAIKSAHDKMGRKVDILLDMSDFDGVYDVEAMEVMADFAKENQPFVDQTAAFGGTDKAVAAGEITSALADRENIKFFSTKEDAVAWLKVI